MVEPSEPKGFWPEWVTPRRWWEFTRNIVRIETSVSKLEIDNRELRAEIQDLQRQLAEVRAQTAILADFVRTSLKS